MNDYTCTLDHLYFEQFKKYLGWDLEINFLLYTFPKSNKQILIFPYVFKLYVFLHTFILLCSV